MTWQFLRGIATGPARNPEWGFYRAGRYVHWRTYQGRQ